jgi:hypothetical protein
MAVADERDKRYTYDEYLEKFGGNCGSSREEAPDVAEELADETLEVFRQALQTAE